MFLRTVKWKDGQKIVPSDPNVYSLSQNSIFHRFCCRELLRAELLFHIKNITFSKQVLMLCGVVIKRIYFQQPFVLGRKLPIY